MLAVEPAKGEYASVFGGRKDVRVFGTNDWFGPMLTINPFAFPAGIHVLEHLERLIQVFNASLAHVRCHAGGAEGGGSQGL